MIKKYFQVFIFIFPFQIQTDGVICATIPKSGTHLIAKLMEKLGFGYKGLVGPSPLSLDRKLGELGKKNFLSPHAIASKFNIDRIIRHNLKVIFLYRDPRDMVCSFANYMKRPQGSPWKARHLSFEQLITDLICNTGESIYATEKKCIWNDPLLKTISNITGFYQLYMGWQDQKNIDIYVTSFEKLIGKAGGGSNRVQFQEIKNITMFLGLSLTPEEIQAIACSLFGGSNTFFKGQVGAWKDYFNEEHKRIFKEIAGDLLIELGYESDYNW